MSITFELMVSMLMCLLINNCWICDIEISNAVGNTFVWSACNCTQVGNVHILYTTCSVDWNQQNLL